MKKVNELVFGSRLEFRPQAEDNLFVETIKEVLNEPENIRMRMILANLRRLQIRNLGERGSVELLGALAIYLTQVPEKQLLELERERRKRLYDATH